MDCILRIYAVDIESKRVRYFTTECRIISEKFLPNYLNMLPRKYWWEANCGLLFNLTYAFKGNA